MADHDSHRPPSPFFAAWARVVIRFRFVILALIAAISALALFQIKNHLQVDNSVEAFSSTDSEASVTLEEFRDEFGRDDIFLIIIKGDVFSLDYVRKVAALDAELKALDMELPSIGERKADRQVKRGKASAPPPPAEQFSPSAADAPDAGALDVGDDDFDDFDDFEELETESGWGDEAGGSVVEEVTSIVTVRKTRGSSGSISVGKLMDPMPETQAALDLIRDEVLGNPEQGIPPSPSLIGQVVNAEGTYSTVLVRTNFMNEEDSAKVHKKLLSILERYRGPGFETWIAGMPAVGASLNDLMLGDLKVMFSISIVMLFLVLFAMFRHPIGAMSPMLVVLLSMLWAMGLTATLGMPMTMLSNILPAFIICVGVADSVHLLSVYRDERKSGVANQDAIINAMASTAVPVIFTTLTTAMGLLSFMTASVDAIGDMGLIGAFAVSMACLHTLVVLPIMLTFNKRSLLGVRHSESGSADFIDRFLRACVNLSGGGARRRWMTLAGALVLSVVAGYGASQLYVWHNPLSWVPADQAIRVAVKNADEHMGGTASVQLLIDAKGEHGAKDEALIKGIAELDQYIREYVDPKTGKKIVGNVLSMVDIVRESNQALLDGDRAHYKIPDGQRDILDRLFAFENQGPAQLKRMMTLDGSRTQMTVRMDWLEATSYFPLQAYIEAGVKKFIPEGAASVRPTGSVYLLLSTVGALLMDLMRSFGVAFAVIACLLMFMLRSVKLGLIAMVPNLMPIVMILGIMGFADIPIDMANLMIASIALGIAVDDTIHFLHQFKVHYERSGDVEASIRHTLAHSGRALVVTSVVLTGGFLVFLGATMYSLQRFGALIAGTVVIALVLDLIVTPALIRLTFRDRALDGAQKGDNPDATTPQAV